jgi:RimJ/RimL family protein N-acetyltransferase
VPPPYRVETERLVIRCWEPSDAETLDAAYDESVAELRVWMEWAAQPTSAPTVEVLRRFRGFFDLGQDFIYGLFDHAGECVGGSGLHPRSSPGTLEIGYWIRTSRSRQGLATEVAAALTRVGIEHCGIERMEIKVEPGNEPSLRVARKLGYREEGVLRRHLPPLVAGGRKRDVVVFSLLPDELAASPCAGVAYEAFDVEGSKL